LAVDRIYQGDVREWLAGLPDESVHCAITSPPYWSLRDYGMDGQLGLEPTPELYIEHMVEVFRDLRRVLREDGTLWLNIGDSYAGSGGPHSNEVNPGISQSHHRFGGAGDTIGTDGYQRQNRNGRGRHGAVESLKPKDLCGMPWRLAFGLQGFAVVPGSAIMDAADLLKEAREKQDWQMVEMAEFMLRKWAMTSQYLDGWYLRSAIVWAKGVSFCDTYSGSLMPESCRDRPTSAYEMVYLLTKNSTYFYDGDAVREAHATLGDKSAHAFGPNANRDGKGTQATQGNDHSFHGAGRNLRNVWTISPQPMAWEMCSACKRVYSPSEFRRLPLTDFEIQAFFVGKELEGSNGVPPKATGKRVCAGCGASDSWLSHFATFPERLVAPMIQAGCPHKVCAECGTPWVREVERESMVIKRTDWGERAGNRTASSGTMVRPAHTRTLGFLPTCDCGGRGAEPGLVIDPFMGSGTVALAAHKFGRRWAGCELNPDYVTLGEERIRRATAQQRLGIEA